MDEKDIQKASTAFQKALLKDRSIGALMKKLNGEDAQYADVYSYATAISEHLIKAVKSVLPESEWDTVTADMLLQILTPMMRHSHGLINDAYALVQQMMNENAGVGLNAVLTQFSDRSERLSGMADRAVELDYEQARRFLEPAIENFNLSLIDDNIRANCDFQAVSGMKVTVTREVMGGCCSWCEGLAGTYDYESIRRGSNVWARHRGCRCTLTFNGEKTVWGGKNSDRWRWKAASDEQRQRNRTGSWDGSE